MSAHYKFVRQPHALPSSPRLAAYALVRAAQSSRTLALFIDDDAPSQRLSSKGVNAIITLPALPGMHKLRQL
jgi:hypothetical protein